MTEEEIRAIVRDEIEEQALKEGGIYDECSKASFNMTRAIVEQVLKNGLASFDPARALPNETGFSDDTVADGGPDGRGH